MQPLGSRYVLEKSIGRGTFGEVWRAVDRAGRPFAVKILRADLTSDSDVLSRFVRERSMIRGLVSPHLVPVHDFVVEGETLAIVMDLIEGHDLKEELTARGTLPPAQALRLTAAVCRGLATVHAAGIVHRDIKPSNILLDPAGDGVTARITDFGVGWLFEDARVTSNSSLAGTPEYMAPEYALGRPVTPSVDVYAAGIMLYELLCGVTPFAGGSLMTVLHRHMNSTPAMPATMPPDVRELLSRLLAKDPADRPTASLAATAMTQLAGQVADAPAAAPLPRPAATVAPAAGPLATADDSRATVLRVPSATVAGAGRDAVDSGTAETVLQTTPATAATPASAVRAAVPTAPAGSSAAPPVGPARRAAGRKRPRRKPALFALGFAVLLMMGGGVAVLTMSDSGRDTGTATPAPPSIPALAVAHDTFARDDSTTALGVSETGQEWTPPSGVWGISSGRAYLLSGAPGVALIDVGLTDVTVAADVVRPWTLAAGVVARGAGASNRIVANFDAASGEFRITTVADATNLTAAAVFVSPAVVPVGAAARIELTVIGDTVTATLDGGFTLSYTLPNPVYTTLTGTAVGLRQTAEGIDTTSFDNFTVTPAGGANSTVSPPAR